METKHTPYIYEYMSIGAEQYICGTGPPPPRAAAPGGEGPWQKLGGGGPWQDAVLSIYTYTYIYIM